MFVREKPIDELCAELLEVIASGSVTDAEKNAIATSYAGHPIALDVLCRDSRLREFFHDERYNSELMKPILKVLKIRLEFPNIKVDSELSPNGRDLLKTIVGQIDKATASGAPESETVAAAVQAVKSIIKLPPIIIYKFMQDSKFKSFCKSFESFNASLSSHFLQPCNLIHFEIHGSNGQKISCVEQYIGQYFINAYRQLKFVRNLDNPDADCLSLLDKACEFGSFAAHNIRLGLVLAEEKSEGLSIEAATAEFANLFGAYGHLRAGSYMEKYAKLLIIKGDKDGVVSAMHLAAKHYLCALFLADEVLSKKMLLVITGSDDIRTCVVKKSGVRFTSPSQFEDFVLKILGNDKETYLLLYKKALEEVARRSAELSKDTDLDDEKTLSPSQ